jgi:hypothetical protein
MVVFLFCLKFLCISLGKKLAHEPPTPGNNTLLNNQWVIKEIGANIIIPRVK